MLSDGARRLSSSLLSAALGVADSPFSDDKHGQNAANALENAIFTATAGDLRAYQQIFRQIYLDLKTQRIKIQVIGRGGFTARFSLRRRSKISRVRAAIAQLIDDPTARFFWRSPAWKMLSDEDTPYSLCMGNRETVYYAGHIVVVHEIVTTTVHSKPSKTTFGVAPTYTLESLRKFFLPGYKQLLYAGKELGPTDTPRTLGTPNIVELNIVSARHINPGVRGNNTSVQNSTTAEDLTGYARCVPQTSHRNEGRGGNSEAPGHGLCPCPAISLKTTCLASAQPLATGYAAQAFKSLWEPINSSISGLLTLALKVAALIGYKPATDAMAAHYSAFDAEILYDDYDGTINVDKIFRQK
ncbi:hypothetical protein B0H14DRAFT_3174526 [Mycena olivaceomarginata]|nr:hypothetical protein B0H14DRAFT_3174526 [Mycena olivaceomarginata]